MTRRLSEQNRHFLTLKSRVDAIQAQRQREESLQALELAGDSIRVTDSTVLTVSVSADLSVTIQSTNSPIETGEILDVTTKVENLDSSSKTADVRLDDFNGNEVDRQSVTLAAGATTTITLQQSTSAGDDGSGDVVVASPTSSDAAFVEIVELTVVDGFEDGNTNAWDQSEFASGEFTAVKDGGVTNGSVFKGVYSAEYVMNDPETSGGEVAFAWPTSKPPQIRFAMRVERLRDAGLLIRVTDTTEPDPAFSKLTQLVGLDQNGNIYESPGFSGDTGVNYPFNEWRVIKSKFDWSAGSYEVFLGDGSGGFNSLYSASNLTSSLTEIRLANKTDVKPIVYFDEFREE